MRSGKTLDGLSGHEASVCDVTFHPSRGTLASEIWDGAVRVWDLYKKGKGGGRGGGTSTSLDRAGDAKPKTFTHSTDVTYLSSNPMTYLFAAARTVDSSPCGTSRTAR